MRPWLGYRHMFKTKVQKPIQPLIGSWSPRLPFFWHHGLKLIPKACSMAGLPTRSTR